MFEAIIIALKFLGIEIKFLIAGLLGALVRTILSGKPFSWGTVFTTIAGTFCAIYFTPVAVVWLGLTAVSPDVITGLAFLIGLIGLSLAEAAIKVTNRVLADPQAPRNLLHFALEYLTRTKPKDKDKTDI